MIDTRAGAKTADGPGRLLGTTVVVGLLAGAAVSLVAFLLARYGPSGDSWSFRGNGALVAYTLLPSLLAAGWTALVVRHKGRASWISFGGGAGVVGLVLAFADAALLPLGGRGAETAIGGVLLVALVAWAVVAPILGWTVVRSGSGQTVGGGTLVAALALWIAGLAVGLIALGIVLPAGS